MEDNQILIKTVEGDILYTIDFVFEVAKTGKTYYALVDNEDPEYSIILGLDEKTNELYEVEGEEWEIVEPIAIQESLKTLANEE